MSIFQKLTSRILPYKRIFAPKSISLHFHPFSELLRQAETQQATTLYLQLEPAEQSLLVEAVSEVVQEDTFFDDWYDEGKGSKLAGLLRGALLTKRAWYYRGGGRGSDVSEDSANLMYDALDRAIETLKPLLYDPIYAREANARCIRVAKGLGLSWDQFAILQANIRDDGDYNLVGELDYLVVSCEKWLGSHQQMFDHAFDAVATFSHAPEMGCLVTAAHWERHMYFERFEGDAQKAESYKLDPKVLREIVNASDRLLRDPTVSDQRHIIAHNIFAGVLSEFNRFDLAKPHFVHMDEQVFPYPWRHLLPEQLQDWHNKAMRT